MKKNYPTLEKTSILKSGTIKVDFETKELMEDAFKINLRGDIFGNKVEVEKPRLKEFSFIINGVPTQTNWNMLENMVKERTPSFLRIRWLSNRKIRKINESLVVFVENIKAMEIS